MSSILIVDDVEEMRTLLEELVAGLPGCKVSGTAKNVWEARLEINRRKPDLLLLDEVLPGESSLDLLTEARELGVPVLLVTGVEEPTHAVPEGAGGRITKPSWSTLEADRARYQAAIAQVLDTRSLSS